MTKGVIFLLKKTLKITFTGYHFNPSPDFDPLSNDGVYEGTWDDKLITKTFSVPEEKVNPALVPNSSGKVTAEAYAAAYANAQAMIFDGIFDMGDLTPVFVTEDTTGDVVRGLGKIYEGAQAHPTQVEIYWEVVEDQPLESA